MFSIQQTEVLERGGLIQKLAWRVVPKALIIWAIWQTLGRIGVFFSNSASLFFCGPKGEGPFGQYRHCFWPWAAIIWKDTLWGWIVSRNLGESVAPLCYTELYSRDSKLLASIPEADITPLAANIANTEAGLWSSFWLGGKNLYPFPKEARLLLRSVCLLFFIWNFHASEPRLHTPCLIHLHPYILLLQIAFPLSLSIY